MSKRNFISAYTPSNMEPQLREDIFVQRHKLLDKTVKWLADSVSGDDKTHLLFIGPRGCGKTNLVSMAEHRLSQIDDIQEAYRVAWLGEDDVVTGFIDLALAILKALIERYPDEFKYEILNQARGIDPDDAADVILKDIVNRLGDRTILLVLENLDLVFRGLQDDGQKKWRAFLQETMKVTTLATSQQLFAGISSRDAAFFGFFDIHHLEPLTFEDARLLIRNIAEQNQQNDLVEFLDSPTGRYRVRALHHLAGGNHRLYIELSEFLTVDSLDGLVEALEGLADELTPFFQERIRSLPPQQAKLVQWLCDYGGAASVKSIAHDTFIQERSVSKQLGELKKKGYVLSEKRGKEAYFELAEPLMRLSMETKNQRGKPLRLIVSFLKVWFSEEALSEKCQSENTFINRHLAGYQKAVLAMDDGFLKDINDDLRVEIVNCIKNKRLDLAQGLVDELPESVCFSTLLALGYNLLRKGQVKGGIEVFKLIVEQKSFNFSNKMMALAELEQAYGELGEYDKLIDYCVEATQYGGDNKVNKSLLLFFIAVLKLKYQPLNEAKIALSNAFERGEDMLIPYVIYGSKLLHAILNHHNETWTETIKWLILLHYKYNFVAWLSSSLVGSIGIFKDEQLSHASIKKWNSVWQEQGAEYASLSVGLQALQAATDTIIDGNDKPLFKLPKEVRELVRPMLIGSS
ncbi:MAG: hypothetical protein HRT35_13330 [Algicola sp.]|nr:hypothetical protein [Algicola sp.]